ncbi:hypothetical protein [Kineothrix alysoides]|nr:hypothetical protein [Kineothrix alysoides]
MEKSLSIIISAITATATFLHNFVFKNINKREDEYYEKVLIPFYNIYYYNSNINAVKFYKKLGIPVSAEYIPKYLLFLLKSNDEEKLKKILILDYLLLYNNDSKK